MKKVNMTKRFEGVYNSYCKSWASDLYDVYNSFSKEKRDAYNYCRELQLKYNGRNFKIIGACNNFFSAGFEYVNNEGKTMFVYITHTNDYEMEVKK